VLRSVVNGQPFESEALAMKTKIGNSSLDINLLNSETDVLAAVGKSIRTPSKIDKTDLDSSAKHERAKK